MINNTMMQKEQKQKSDKQHLHRYASVWDTGWTNSEGEDAFRRSLALRHNELLNALATR